MSMIAVFMYFNLTKDVKLDEKRLGVYDSSESAFFDGGDLPVRTKKDFSYAEIGEMPKNLIEAFIATEDRRFFKHNGIDIVRIFGALKNDILSMSFKEGASTINQQLIKNTHLSDEKTLGRKIKEAKLALDLDRGYPKEKILELYLNSLYYGSGIYGVKYAARYFFDKNLNALTLSECALLAGAVKNPAKFSPVRNYKNALDRKNAVLKYMLACGFIADGEYAREIEVNPAIYGKEPADFISNAYFKAAAEEAANILKIDKREILSGKYRIYTYYDAAKQRLLNDTSSDESRIMRNPERKPPDVVSLIADNYDCGIEAFYSNPPLNSIFALRRQPGSTLKPLLVYAPAIKNGLISPATPIYDAKKSFKDGYSPSNYKDKYAGWTTVRNALKQSSNVAAVEILDKLGMEKAKEFALRIGIELSEKDGLSAALGGLTDGVGPLKLAAGYTMLANAGCYRKIGFVRKILSPDGSLLYKKSSGFDRVLSAEDAYLITDILKETTKSGTTKLLSSLPFEVASKSGTVANPKNQKRNNDAWCIAYTTCHTVLSWQGNLKNSLDSSLDSGVTGGGFPTLTAKEILLRLYKDYKPSDFVLPQGIVKLKYDREIFQKEHRLVFGYSEQNAYSDIFNAYHPPEYE